MQDEAFAQDAYINPFFTLHTTLMTCHGFAKPKPSNPDEYIECWRRVIGASLLLSYIKCVLMCVCVIHFAHGKEQFAKLAYLT